MLEIAYRKNDLVGSIIKKRGIMPNFINIASAGTDPLLIDADDVSVVVEGRKKPHQFITILSSKRSWQPCFGKKHQDIDADAVVELLAQNGNRLSEFPRDGNQGRIFVSPGAFNFILTTAPYVPDDETAPYVTMRLAVDGHSWIQRRTPLENIENFLCAVKSCGTDVKRIGPGTAADGFSHPHIGFSAYDPRKILSVQPYSNDGVNVGFQSGGVISFRMPELEDDRFDSRLNKRRGDAAPEDSRKRFGKLLKFEADLRRRTQREFTRAVAADAPELVKIENASTPLYTRLTNVVQMGLSTGEDDKTFLMICYPQDTPDGACIGTSGQRYVPFRDRETAERELARLQKVLRTPNGPQ